MTIFKEVSTIYLLSLTLILVSTSYIDIKKYIIPNKIIILGVVLAITFNSLGLGIGISNSIIGGTFSGVLVYIIIVFLEGILKLQIMGGGDIKLISMIGFFLGLKGVITAIILSFYIGSFYGIGIILWAKIRKNKYTSKLAYAPIISLSAFIIIAI